MGWLQWKTFFFAAIFWEEEQTHVQQLQAKNDFVLFSADNIYISSDLWSERKKLE